MIASRVIYRQFGRPQDVIHTEPYEVEPPRSGELLVRMAMRPINLSDLLPVKGVYAHRITLPAVPGYEGIGIVEEVGASVSSQWIGRRVLPLRGEGTWQQYARVPAEWAVAVPDSIEDVAAAQLYINPLTALVTCVDKLQLTADDVLLVNACGSSIGIVYAQLSALIGFKLIAIVRNHNYTDELLGLGAAHVINVTEASMHEAVMELTQGRGADAAIDSIGGQDGASLASCVRASGVVLSIGLLSGQAVNWSEVSQRAKVEVQLFHLRHWNEHTSVQVWHERFSQLLQWSSERKMLMRAPGNRFDLQDVKQAVSEAESLKRSRGKIILSG